MDKLSICPSQEEILAVILQYHYNDLEFIEKLNEFTYSRKIQLKAKAKKGGFVIGD